MKSAAELVLAECWIPYPSVGFGDGRIVMLETRRDEAGTHVHPILDSSLSSYFAYNEGCECSLFEMWRHRHAGMLWVGGGGGLEEDGYVALLTDGGQLVWIVFLVDTGPLTLVSAERSRVVVSCGLGGRLEFDPSDPCHIKHVIS